MARGSLEVIEYVARPASSEAISVEHPVVSEDFLSRLRLQHQTLTSYAAAIVVLALHALVVVPAICASTSSPHTQEQRYQGDTAMQVVILEDSSAKAGPTRPTFPLTLARIGVSEALLPQPSTSLPAETPNSGSAADQSGFGELYGRYLGQIRARINRAWERPRSAIGAPIFQCQVQVDQDNEGRVEQVILMECNGRSAWQRSLVEAIDAASPLPPPSNQAVFVHHILLDFRAVAYSPGDPAALYEPARVVAVSYPQNARASSQNAFQRLREATQAQKPRVLKLQIEGSKVEVEPERQ